MISGLHRKLLLGSSIVVGSLGVCGRHATADCISQTEQNFVCSGTNSTPQIISDIENLAVTTAPSFSVDVSHGPLVRSGLGLRGSGDITFIDKHIVGQRTSVFNPEGDMGLELLNTRAVDGSASTEVTTNGTFVGRKAGLYITNYTAGPVAITTGEGEVSSTRGNAIQVNMMANTTATAVSTGSGKITGNDNGIYLINDGSGPVIIGTGDGDVTGSFGYGIFASDLNGRELTVRTGKGNVLGGAIGIGALHSGTGELTVQTGVGSVTGSSGFGLFAFAENKSTGVMVLSGDGSILGETNGMNVLNNGSGQTFIGTYLGKGNIVGTTGAGIHAYSDARTGELSIRTGDGYITGGTIGIDAKTIGSGASGFTGEGDVVGGDTGISLENSGTGSLAIETNQSAVIGRVSYGISAMSGANTNTLEITTGGGPVMGGVAGIRASHLGKGTFSIAVDGLVSNVTQDVEGLAIATTGHGVKLDSGTSGKITGRIMTSVNSAVDDTFNNRGTWYSGGTSNFGGGLNQINNFGIVKTASNAALAEETLFDNASIFANQSGALLTLSDEPAGGGARIHDTLTITGNFNGGGTLELDAFLNGGGSTADLLNVGGDISGTTSLRINNTNGDFGTSDAIGKAESNGVSKGVVNVSYAGSANDDAFALENGPISSGLLTYDLVHNVAAKEFELVGVGASEHGYEMASSLTAAQAVWGQSSDSLGDHLDDVHAQESAAAVVGDSRITPASDNIVYRAGPWAKIFGRTSDGHTRTGQNYDADSSGIVMGIDRLLSGTVNGSDLSLGATAGYVNADQRFNTGAKAEYDGFSTGIYTSLTSNGLRVDSQMQASFLGLDYKMQGAPSSHSKVNSFGGSVEAGYRIAVSNTLYAEPIVNIAYVDTSIRNGKVGSMGFKGDGNSLRTGTGINLGGTFADSGNIVFKPTISAKIWNELEGENSVTYSSLKVSDSAPKTVGQVGFNLEAVDQATGWSGQINSDVQFANRFSSFGGFVGLGKTF